MSDFKDQLDDDITSNAPQARRNDRGDRPLPRILHRIRGLPIVGLLASLNVDANVIRHAERSGFLVAAVGDEIMELKSRPGLAPKRLD